MDNQATEKKIAEVAEKIAEKCQPQKIILFGSWAWGKPTKDSDVDLFIVKETDNTRKTAMEIDGLVFPRHFPIDFVVYTPSQLKRELGIEEPFVSKIAMDGKILYEKK